MQTFQELLYGLLKEYYGSLSHLGIRGIERREFGFGDLERTIAYRHFGFRTEQSLLNYLVQNPAPFVSYSISEYERPTARPMENKKWIGAELAFDIDATDLHLSCQVVHGNDWVCENCFSSVKNEAFRLIEDFLVPDFGFSKNDISVNFSGNRGYHVHVFNDEIFGLGPKARKQITDYISAANIDISHFFPTMGEKGKPLMGPTPNSGGWGGKLAKGVISLLNQGPEALEAVGVENSIARKLVKNKAEVILGIATNGNWDKVSIPKKVEFWSNVLSSIAIKQSDAIDRNVTNDKYHLIRMPNSIHGKSGLISKSVSLSDLEKFEPARDAIAFKKGTLKVKVSSSPQFVMNEMSFGPYKDSVVELPTYAAVYLILKHRASLVE
ncbi:MAG: DNA primase catalytic subunit PriS [Candidatus Micrarchaeia archaeon]